MSWVDALEGVEVGFDGTFADVLGCYCISDTNVNIVVLNLNGKRWNAMASIGDVMAGCNIEFPAMPRAGDYLVAPSVDQFEVFVGLQCPGYQSFANRTALMDAVVRERIEPAVNVENRNFNASQFDKNPFTWAQVCSCRHEVAITVS